MSADKLRRSEMVTFGKAFNDDWPIEPKYRAAIINRLMAIIADKTSSKREITSASRVLISAQKQNQSAQQHADEIDSRGNRFLDVARRLGIDATPERLPD